MILNLSPALCFKLPSAPLSLLFSCGGGNGSSYQGWGNPLGTPPWVLFHTEVSSPGIWWQRVQGWGPERGKCGVCHPKRSSAQLCVQKWGVQQGDDVFTSTQYCG